MPSTNSTSVRRARSTAPTKLADCNAAGRAALKAPADSVDLLPTAAEIAHNVNNLLAIIAGNIQIIASGISQPQLNRAVREAVLACNMAASTNAALFRKQRGFHSFATATTARNITNNLTGLLSSLLGTGIELRSEIPDDCWTFEVDSNDISAAIINIALNAHYAMPAGGTFHIKAANVTLDASHETPPAGLPVGRYVRLTFQDTGVGMSADELSEAVKPNVTSRRERGGTGLGLSSTLKFARACGGALIITSTKDAGTEVDLWLPAHAA